MSCMTAPFPATRTSYAEPGPTIRAQMAMSSLQVRLYSQATPTITKVLLQ